MEDLKL
ncbi:tcdA/TcdB catalytic glycosyltransferase domain protein, partial [Escherichia coli PA39]